MTLSDLRNKGISLTLNEAKDGFNAHGPTALLRKLVDKIKAEKPALLEELLADPAPLSYEALREKILFARHGVELEWIIDQVINSPHLTVAQVENLAVMVKREAHRIVEGLVNVPVGTGWEEN